MLAFLSPMERLPCGGAFRKNYFHEDKIMAMAFLSATCMLGVLGALIAGVAYMAAGKDDAEYAERSNRLMGLRVGLQALALCSLALLAYMR
ncbi:MAG: HIG1 domain-containing protein [Rickettsiales bacterium]